MTRKFFFLLFFAVIIIIGYAVVYPKVQAVIFKLTPPVVPPLQHHAISQPLEQGWSAALAQEFRHKGQGTRTVPFPLSWFEALEVPNSNGISWLYDENPLFHENEYLLRFGFISSPVSAINPQGLPIGFAILNQQRFDGVEGSHQALGFTCAACHTGKITVKSKDYVIDGGSANIALDVFNDAMAAAIGQTVISSTLPLFDGRFQRFSERVLGDDNNKKFQERLKMALLALATQLSTQLKHVEVIEGFARLDALNRIGNQIFAIDVQRNENYVPPHAPVNYPHIWTAPWFDWVQYDGSIMQPLIRNAGEALGVRARLEFIRDDSGVTTLVSSVLMEDLAWIEKTLAGNQHPLEAKAFTGLQAPKWPDEFGSIDAEKSEKGSKLYKKHCQQCHLPVLSDDDIFSDAYWHAFEVGAAGMPVSQSLKLKKIPLWQIGTDAEQAGVLMNRTVDTAAHVDAPAFGLNAQVCTQKKQADGRKVFSIVNIQDGENTSFALALGAITHQLIIDWGDTYNISDNMLWRMRGSRPNCLQANLAYKARPLNGVWATAPFLHNGSIASLYEMLLPAKQRRERIRLGSTDFDVDLLGIRQPDSVSELLEGKAFDAMGYFWLNTKGKGNSNKGHEFSARYQDKKTWQEQERGIIGPLLSDEDRFAIIEYLKTL